MTATHPHTIALFGGTGKTGRHVLEQALAAGHSVRMLARRPEAVSAASDRLTVIGGDVLDAAAVERVVEGADAVVSVFGQVKGSRPRYRLTAPASSSTR